MITIADVDSFPWNGQMIRFQIMGETPSKKNSKIRTKSGYMIPSKAHQKWHSDALIQLNAQICQLEPMPNLIDYPVIIRIDFYHGDYVRRDSDNQVSSLMDLLQDAGVLSDDNWQIVRQIHVRNYYDKLEARCLIEIEKYLD
jgi:Holliday junction resolvase RusA-like endonuclease